MPEPQPCLQARGAGSWLDVSVVPGARRTHADGLHDGALRVKLTARPVEGQANAALLAWLADELHCPRRALRLVSGNTSRRKRVEIDVATPEVAAWLHRCIAGTP